MDLLSIVILAFGVLELLNVVILYFAPGFTQGGNGVAVFNAWEKSKEFPELHAFVRYLVNWVAGTKLIFLALLVVVVAFGNEATRLAAVVSLVVTVATYYWRLHPLICKMDAEGWITPKGYSKTLGLMIGGFLLVFVGALAAWGLLR
jgi:hypothetical protein